MFDNMMVVAAVEKANEGTPEGHGVDYKYNHTNGMHTLTLRHVPDVQVKTTVDERAMNFLMFYNAGRVAGALAMKEAREVAVAEENVERRHALRRYWDSFADMIRGDRPAPGHE